MKKLSADVPYGGMVGLVNARPGEEESLLATWSGATFIIGLKDAEWEDVMAHFYRGDAGKTAWPEKTTVWTNPDFSPFDAYVLEGDDSTDGWIYTIVFVKQPNPYKDSIITRCTTCGGTGSYAMEIRRGVGAVCTCEDCTGTGWLNLPESVTSLIKEYGDDTEREHKEHKFHRRTFSLLEDLMNTVDDEEDLDCFILDEANRIVERRKKNRDDET